MTKQMAIVVGASSDIGGAIAHVLAQQGMDLVLWGRNEARLQELVQRLGTSGVQTRVDVVDVTDRPAVKEAVLRATQLGAVKRVVWCSGIFDWASVQDADPDTWDQVLDVNLSSAAYVSQLVSEALITAAPSHLVFIASAASREAHANNAAYIASKHGLLGLSHALFQDLRDFGVKVTAVCPGLVAAGAGLLSPAGQTRPDDLMTAHDVAEAVSFALNTSPTCCPTAIDLHPQRNPDSSLAAATTQV